MFKPSAWFKIWIYILWNVNFEDNGVKEGSKFLRYDWISWECNVTYNQVAECISWLKQEGMIFIDRRPNGWIIEVAKWWEYQSKNTIPKPNHNRITTESQPNAIIKNTISEEINNMFEIFWKIYIRKISKPKALSIFEKIKDKEKVLEWTQRWCDYWIEEKTDIKYIPHPTTFLNWERYNDETPKWNKKQLSEEDKKKWFEAVMNSFNQ